MLPAQKFLLVAGLGLVVHVGAQAPQWGQCGGTGWSGPTTCVSGSVCTAMNPYYSQCVPGSAAPTTTSSSPPTSTSTSSSSGTNYWFSFGDSYTSTGFNPSGTAPNRGNPIGNPNFPGSTTTGGANWVDFDTATYNNSLVLTWNYAVGGSTIDPSLVSPYGGSTFTSQVDQFLNGAAKKPSSAPWTSQNALFSMWFGINDLGWSHYQSGNRISFNDALLNAHFALVQKLYNAGARNFLFVNVPPIERTPFWTGPNDSQFRSLIQDFNSKLASRMQSFKSSNSGVTTYLWDSFTTFDQILNNPTAYGFRDATTHGTGNDLFWGNDGGQGLHPSSGGHKVLAQAAAKVLQGTVW